MKKNNNYTGVREYYPPSLVNKELKNIRTVFPEVIYEKYIQNKNKEKIKNYISINENFKIICWEDRKNVKNITTWSRFLVYYNKEIFYIVANILSGPYDESSDILNHVSIKMLYELKNDKDIDLYIDRKFKGKHNIIFDDKKRSTYNNIIIYQIEMELLKYILLYLNKSCIKYTFNILSKDKILYKKHDIIDYKKYHTKVQDVDDITDIDTISDLNASQCSENTITDKIFIKIFKDLLIIFNIDLDKLDKILVDNIMEYLSNNKVEIINYYIEFNKNKIRSKNSEISPKTLKDILYNSELYKNLLLILNKVVYCY